jgi:hypothetical protein
MTTEDESHIIRTTGRRMAKGLAIIVVVIAFGAAVAVPNWHNFAKNPPPVSTITTKPARCMESVFKPVGRTTRTQ